jgi:lipopolysaccharide export system permease protein
VKIIERYIARELLRPFTVVSVTFMGLYGSFISARLLSEGVTNTLGGVVMLKLLLLKTLIALEVVMPIAIYIAIVMALSRLHRDQEIVVLRSAGVSENRLIYAVLLIVLPVGIMSGVLSIFVRPWAYKESYSLNSQAEGELNTDRFQAGRFYGSEGSGRVVYIESKDDAAKQMEGIFHYMKKPDRSEIIVAKEARQQPPTAGERPQIHLYDGYIYQLMRSPDEKDTIVKFEKLIYFTDNKAVAEINRKATTTSALSQSDRPKDIAEFQWRLSRPVATILLALIAVPLSRVSPRQDKSTRTYLIAAGVSSLYYVLSVLAQNWVLRGDVGRVPGLWWLHGLMLVIVLFLLFPRTQRLRRVSSSG